ncbi:lipopolysaccharide biosynthesis protein [Turicibacter bilis]|uniref:Oligosaccharide flippase family protein n=1 Tax=Turicibacter bilis TaxID=2735723 RepID=A0ABY5JPB3_9FIRM|nr:oligosaccharide flippase family protein [Turicibacter bilis]MBS3200924.1 oligosaccharide flippase family protein [Turicibacter bilis]UUF07101.1 oligosaccharide flippase family protein [Turicibacter bilis]
MKSNNQLKIGAILSYFSLGIGNVISILYTPIMLRLLGQSEYGLYNLSNSIIGYLGVLDFGIGNAVIRYTAKYKALEDKDGESNLYGMFIVIYSILAVLVILAGSFLVMNTHLFFSSSLTNDEMTRIRFMMALMIFNLAISFPFGIFGAIITAHEQFVFPKLVGLVRQVLNPFVMIPLLLLGYKSLGMTVASTCLNLIFIWVNLYYCFKVLKIKVKFNKMDFSVLKEIMGYSFFIFLNMIVDKIYWSTDQFILGSVRGTVAVAVYSIGSTFNQYYMNFSTAISGVFLPKVTKMVTKNVSREELSNLFIRTGRIQFIILSFILSGFVLVGKEFIAIWAGDGYEQSYFIALLVMIPLTIPLIQNLGITILQAKNMHHFRSTVYIIIAILNVITSIPLAKMYGGVGCALATGISMVIGNIIIINIYYYKKIHINIPKFWLEISKLSIPVVISLGIMLAINKIVSLNGIIDVLFTGMTFTVIFVPLMWLLGMNNSEKELFIGPIKMIGRKLRRVTV